MPYIPPDESDVLRVASNVVDAALSQVPYDAQDAVDQNLATMFILQQIASRVNPRLEKLKDAIKKAIKDGDLSTDPVTTKNYQRTIDLDTPRTSFDKDAFITKLVAEYPDLLKHKLVELAADCTKLSAAPIKISIEYIGHLPRAE